MQRTKEIPILHAALYFSTLLPDGRIFQPNNLKEAPKNFPWQEKIGVRKMAEFC
jgi:hypothetical protein